MDYNYRLLLFIFFKSTHALLCILFNYFYNDIINCFLLRGFLGFFLFILLFIIVFNLKCNDSLDNLCTDMTCKPWIHSTSLSGDICSKTRI